MSLPSFSSKFKKAMGMTPNDYLASLKLNEAARLLKFSSVTEVAYDLGYENISHFLNYSALKCQDSWATHLTV